jgi:NAD(P)-dependent dehydrogenase (short-subunit alcohol dehydrogenase family)
VRIEGCVALVTGANRGLGRALVRELVGRGARTVYGATRTPGTITDPGVTPLTMDITRPEDIVAAAARAGDVTLLINNAGIDTSTSPISAPKSEAEMRRDLETNLFGTAEMCRRFAPVLGANGGGAILNVLSAASFVAVPNTAGYSVSKAAAWSFTNVLRLELLNQGTQVVGLHMSYLDTDQAATRSGGRRLDPARVAASALDGLEAGQHEVLADTMTRMVKKRLGGDPVALYPSLARPGS